MFRFAIFATLVTLSVATKVKECGHGFPLPDDVRIDGCDILPCRAVKGEEAHMQVDFTLKKPAKDINTRVVVHALGWTFDYNLPDGKGKVCKNLVGGASCPLAANETSTYDLRLPVYKDLPSVDDSFTMYIEDDEFDWNLISCFKVDVQVVDP